MKPRDVFYLLLAFIACSGFGIAFGTFYSVDIPYYMECRIICSKNNMRYYSDWIRGKVPMPDSDGNLQLKNTTIYPPYTIEVRIKDR